MKHKINHLEICISYNTEQSNYKCIFCFPLSFRLIIIFELYRTSYFLDILFLKYITNNNKNTKVFNIIESPLFNINEFPLCYINQNFYINISNNRSLMYNNDDINK